MRLHIRPFFLICVIKHTFLLDNLQIYQKSVSLQCVFHSIRFKVNKGWSTAVLLFLCPYVSFGGEKSPGLCYRFLLIVSFLPPFYYLCPAKRITNDSLYCRKALCGA